MKLVVAEPLPQYDLRDSAGRLVVVQNQLPGSRSWKLPLDEVQVILLHGNGNFWQRYLELVHHVFRVVAIAQAVNVIISSNCTRFSP